MEECKRCGKCCVSVGRTFWKIGDYEKYPELNDRANNGDYEDNGKPCEMLRFENGIAVCIIEREYGRDVKPVACREYPECNDEPCFFTTQPTMNRGKS